MIPVQYIARQLQISTTYRRSHKHWGAVFFSTSQENRRGILELRELATMFLQVSTWREVEFADESFAWM
jgi:hypothetical protein